MNIKARVNARQLVLSYFYEKYFFLLLKSNNRILQELIVTDKMLRMSSDEDETTNDFTSNLLSHDSQPLEEIIEYYVDNFFDQQKEREEIDYDYVFKIAPLFDSYLPKIRDQVNKHITTFTFDEMDITDKVIFLLGYIEFHEIKTPKEIILNELIELGKLYGDDGTSKLVNGIMHKIFLEESPVKVETPEEKEEKIALQKRLQEANEKSKKMLDESLKVKKD